MESNPGFTFGAFVPMERSDLRDVAGWQRRACTMYGIARTHYDRGDITAAMTAQSNAAYLSSVARDYAARTVS